MLLQPEFLYFDRSNDQLFFGYPDGTTSEQLKPVATAIRKQGFKIGATKILDLPLQFRETPATGVLVAHKKLQGQIDLAAVLQSLRMILQPRLATILHTRAEFLLCECGRICTAATKTPSWMPYFGPEDQASFYAAYLAGLQEIPVHELVRGSDSPLPLTVPVYELLTSLGACASWLEVNYAPLPETCTH